MVKGFRANLLIYLLLTLLMVTVFAGFVYWTLPMIQEMETEEVPIAPDEDQEPKAKVLNPPVQAAPPQSVPVKTGLEPVSQIVNQVGASVVKITTVQERVDYDFFFGQTRDQIKGEGSGVIFDEKGYIITNNHVVENADQIKVFLTDRDGQVREYTGQVLGRDPLTDLAIVQINGKNLVIAELGDSDKVEVGDTAIAIGNPFGFANTVTVGVISALNRNLPIREGTELLDLIQTDAAINPGNSGGALFSINGKVVGINTAILQGAQGLGFAIPINIAREIASELIENGRVSRPWIGIYGSTVFPEVREQYDLRVSKGVFVYQVVPGSPADRSGMQEFDVITEVGGKKVVTMEDFLSEIRQHKIGERVEIVVDRNGRDRKLEIVLEERPETELQE